MAEDTAQRRRRPGERHRRLAGGETLTVTAATAAAPTARRRSTRPDDHLHAGAELLRHGQLHLHDRRRQRRHRHGDGRRDGHRASTTRRSAVDDAATTAEDTAVTSSRSWRTTSRPRRRQTLTVSAVTPGARHGDGQRSRDGNDHLHAGRQLPRRGQLQLHDRTTAHGGSDATADVNVTVTEVNDAPSRSTTRPRSPRTRRSSSTSLANDRRARPTSDQTLTVSAVGARAPTAPDDHRRATVTLHAAGELQRRGQLHLHDQGQRHDQRRERHQVRHRQVNVTVTEVNDAPMAGRRQATVAEDTERLPRRRPRPTTATARPTRAARR